MVYRWITRMHSLRRAIDEFLAAWPEDGVLCGDLRHDQFWLVDGTSADFGAICVFDAPAAFIPAMQNCSVVWDDVQCVPQTSAPASSSSSAASPGRPGDTVTALATTVTTTLRCAQLHIKDKRKEYREFRALLCQAFIACAQDAAPYHDDCKRLNTWLRARFPRLF